MLVWRKKDFFEMHQIFKFYANEIVFKIQKKFFESLIELSSKFKLQRWTFTFKTSAIESTFLSSSSLISGLMISLIGISCISSILAE